MSTVINVETALVNDQDAILVSEECNTMPGIVYMSPYPVGPGVVDYATHYAAVSRIFKGKMEGTFEVSARYEQAATGHIELVFWTITRR
jgi:hypothetical protein